MTINEEDYKPRPADDFWGIPSHNLSEDQSESESKRYGSIIDGAICRGYYHESECHQLGCNFQELPHG